MLCVHETIKQMLGSSKKSQTSRKGHQRLLQFTNQKSLLYRFNGSHRVYANDPPFINFVVTNTEWCARNTTIK